MVGGEWYKDYAAVQRRTPAGSGGQAWAAYLKAKGATSEGYGNAFKELDIAARQEGVIANRPAVASNMSQAQYQEALSQYLANINNEVLKKNVTNALKDVQKQGMQAGVNVGLPTLANLTSANADSFVNNYINTVNQRIYINYATTAIKDLQAQGVANGVNVAVPVISNNISQAQAQEIVNKYQSQINRALLVKSTQDALKSVQSQAKSYGVNVAVPTISAGITEQAANALVDRYAADVNAKLSSVTVSESKPASNNQIQTSAKVNTALVGPATPTTTVAAPTVSIARNSDGSLAVNEGLYNQLKAAQTQYKSWWNDYSGIPQQVIDSRATDVRINSKGQFEWTPVTGADKAQLDKINVQRTRSGLAPRTTLIHGPEKSTEYNTKWLSTTGSGSRGVGESGVKVKDASGKTIKSYDYNTANLAKVGSGDIKIAAMKAGSSINSNASARINNKAVVLTRKEWENKYHPGEVQLKDGTWINQIEKVGNNSTKEAVTLYSSKAERNAIIETQIKSQKEYKKQIEAFNDVLAEFGTVSIVTQGHRGTGEGNVFAKVPERDANGKVIKNADGSIKYIARSQTASTYKQIERQTPKLANTAILPGMSAADKKAIEAARERMLLGLKFAEATKLKTEWANTDYNTNKALKLYNSALGKYNVVDFESFAKEFADIEKATRGMSDADKKKYLLDVEKSKLPESGKASDLWRTLNTDVTEALKITPSLAGVYDGFGGKKAITVKWDAKNANVDEKFAGIVKSGSISDVIDNISNKQVNGKPLTANEVSLLTAISAGYQPGATTSQISAYSTSKTEAVQAKMQTYQKTYKAGDNFAGVRLSTSLAEWANDLQAGALSAVGVVGATVGGAPQAAGYVWSQAAGIKSYDSAKNAVSTVGLATGLVGTQMTRGMAKSYHEDRSKFAAELVLTQALFSGIGKAGKYGVVKPTKYTALKTGVTRTKTLGSEIIPYREAGTILDTLRYEKKVTGMHASQIKDSARKKVFMNNPIGTEFDPSTFGKKGRFATVSDKFVDPFGEYFLNKGKVARFNKTIRLPAKEVKSKIVTTVKGKFVKTTTDFNEYGGTVYKNEFRNPALSRAAKKAENVKAGIKTSKAAKSLKVVQETKAGKAAGWVASKAANIPKKNYAKNKAKFTTRNVRTSEKIVDRVTADAVKLTETQWNRIYKKFSEKGEFWDEYKKVTDIAQKQADKSGKPVAIPSPKVAKGMMEAENEVFLIFPKKGVKITSKQKLGKTKQGVEVYEVRYGKQAPIVKKSVAQRMKENREYNKQMVKAVDGKKYNLNYIKSYANDANRRLGELYGSKTTRPGAYEQGAHGKKHTEQVGKNVASLGVEQETSYWLGVMHDVTKIGPHESAGIPHAIAAAEAIKRGLIQDARFNKFYNGLSKAKQKEFYEAVGEHTTIKPINRHLLTEWDLSLKQGGKFKKRSDLNPVKSLKERASLVKQGVKTSIKDRPSRVSKALANADRMDLTRFGHKVQKRQVFGNLKDSVGLKVENKVKNTVKAGSKKLSVPSVKTRVRNALKAETRTATSQNKVKVIEKKPVKQTEAKSQYKKPEKEYAGNKYTQAAKAYGSLAAYQSGLASASKYLKSAETKGSNAGYKKPVTAARKSYKPGYNKPKSGVKSGYYKQSKEYKSSYKPSYTKKQAYKPAYVTPYAKKSEYSGKYAKGGEYESGYGSNYKASGYGGGYNGGYGSGYGGGYGGGYPRPTPGSKVSVAPRAKLGTKRIKVYTNRKNFERDIKNVLGSMQSIFG